MSLDYSVGVTLQNRDRSPFLVATDAMSGYKGCSNIAGLLHIAFSVAYLSYESLNLIKNIFLNVASELTLGEGKISKYFDVQSTLSKCQLKGYAFEFFLGSSHFLPELVKKRFNVEPVDISKAYSPKVQLEQRDRPFLLVAADAMSESRGLSNVAGLFHIPLAGVYAVYETLNAMKNIFLSCAFKASLKEGKISKYFHDQSKLSCKQVRGYCPELSLGIAHLLSNPFAVKSAEASANDAQDPMPLRDEEAAQALKQSHQALTHCSTIASPEGVGNEAPPPYDHEQNKISSEVLEKPPSYDECCGNSVQPKPASPPDYPNVKDEETYNKLLAQGSSTVPPWEQDLK